MELILFWRICHLDIFTDMYLTDITASPTTPTTPTPNIHLHSGPPPSLHPLSTPSLGSNWPLHPHTHPPHGLHTHLPTHLLGPPTPWCSFVYSFGHYQSNDEIEYKCIVDICPKNVLIAPKQATTRNITVVEIISEYVVKVHLCV